ncbi:MAG: hypothetical protein KDD52_10265, partial [Bdellovibrionales bacterium]|nr:hypothetical protein [Bdellovibrionales bacterium]
MNSLFGILNVNKPAGLTSRDIVNHVKKIIRTEKVGHTGTLDPLATGVLLLAVGRATRLVDFAHDMTKRYDAEFELGLESDTLDIEGTIRQIIPAHIPSKC